MQLPPLDGIWLCTCLREAGLDTRLVDASHPDAPPVDTEELLDIAIVEVQLPSLTGDLAFAGSLRASALWLRSSIDEEDVLRDALEVTGARGVLIGQNYAALVAALRGEAHAGTVRLEDGVLVRCEAPPLHDTDALPLPDRTLTGDLEYRYPLLDSVESSHRFTTIKTSWGCPFSCGYYCPYPLGEGERGIFRSAEHVLAELEQMAHQGYGSFLTRDATFTLSPKRIRAICEGMIERELDFTWWCETRIDLCDRDLLELMQRAGLRGLNVGIETGDPDLMSNALKTGLDHERIETFVRDAREIGLEFHILCVLGLPCETRETVRKSFRFLDRLRPESLNFTFATPYPGTKYARDAAEYGWNLEDDFEKHAANHVVARSIFLDEDELRFAMDRIWRFVGAYRTGDEATCTAVRAEVEAWAGEATWPWLSVLIPTYDRADKLRACLQRLAQQTLPPHCFEVVVVDDGSSDDTQAVLAEFAESAPFALRAYRQDNAGPAAARNRALREAGGQVVLYIGDDILLAPEALQHHVAWHRAHPEDHMAMVGRVDWAKNVRRDDFVRWLDTTNLQFDFEHATHGESRGYGGFYTSNLSLKRAFHLEHGLFDEDFRHAIWEDIELGYRLCEQGLDIVYNSLAQAWHDEVVTIERFEKRQELVGYYTELVLRKNPDLLERSESTLDAVRRSRDLLRDTNANERDERFAARLDLAFARGLERAITESHARDASCPKDLDAWLRGLEANNARRVRELRDAIDQLRREFANVCAEVARLTSERQQLETQHACDSRLLEVQRRRIARLHDSLRALEQQRAARPILFQESYARGS
ncbi:MAG: glycosyltransferase [Planctomycetes bacterium]|nr:glycosyltransferase [Planctomycetota bacterium]